MKKEHYGRVIVLNGPPGTGKDTIANYLHEIHHNWFHARIKGVLFKQAVEISGISPEEWFDRYNTEGAKELPWIRLGGLSQREFLIKISEEWVKPVFGKTFYGSRAAEDTMQIISQGVDVVFSDGGFQEEFNEIRDTVGPENILLVRLHRDGHTFDNDSRSHLNHLWSIDITTDTTVTTVGASAVKILNELNK